MKSVIYLNYVTNFNKKGYIHILTTLCYLFSQIINNIKVIHTQEKGIFTIIQKAFYLIKI